MQQGLSVGDGFKFGCGFMLAAFVAWLAVAIVGGIVMAIFGSAITALMGSSDILGQLPVLLGFI